MGARTVGAVDERSAQRQYDRGNRSDGSDSMTTMLVDAEALDVPLRYYSR